MSFKPPTAATEDPVENFMWACKTGDLNGVKKFVEQDKLPVSSTFGNSKRTGLHAAADFGKSEVIEYLVSKGAKVNEKDNFGITPLLAAVYEGHADAVAALLKKGADKSIQGPDGLTALQAAEKDEVKALLK